MAKDIKPNSEQVEMIFGETVRQYHLYAEYAPKVLIVSGVSGSGKSTLMTGLLERHRLNFFPIQADDYRKLHPKIREFREKYGFDEAHKKTGNFAHRFATELLNKAVEKQFNVLYETTFGNMETANNLIAFFKKHAYEINILGLPADVELSVERNKARYQEKILAQSSLPRIVERSVIERMAVNYLQCLEQLKEDNSIHLFEVKNTQSAQAALEQILEI